MEIVAFVVLGPRRFSHEEWLIGSNLVDPFWLKRPLAVLGSQLSKGENWLWSLAKDNIYSTFAGRLFRHAICIKNSTFSVIGRIHWSQFVRRIFTDFSPHEIMKLPPPPLQKNHEIQYLPPTLYVHIPLRLLTRILLASLPGRGRV